MGTSVIRFVSRSSAARSTAIMLGLLTLFLFVIPEALAQFGSDRNLIPSNIEAAGGKRGDLIEMIRIVLDWVLGFLGIICIAIVIYAGFMYVTAGVNDANAESAKKTLTYAALGVVVIILSFVLVNAVLGAAQPR